MCRIGGMLNTTKRPLRERVEIDSRTNLQTYVWYQKYMNINDKDEEINK